MKRLAWIPAVLWGTTSFGQTLSWSAEYDVSGTGYKNVRPRIALTTGNAPIVLWGDDVNNVVYTARWNGTGFDAPVRVNPLSAEAFTSYWAGPEIAAAGDTVFVGLKIKPEDQHGVYSVRSVDGGQTYGDTVRIDMSADSLTRFPTVAIAAGGNPVFAYMKMDSLWADPQYHVANSTDGGLTFNPDVNGTALAPGEVCDCCPANIQVQGNRQVLLFRNNDNNLREIWASVSDDGGATFSLSERIDTSNWIIFGCPSTGPDAVLNGNQMVATYMSAGSGKSKIYAAEADLTNLQLNFQAKLQSKDTVTAQSNYPRMAGGDDLVGVVWQYTEFGNVNVYFSASGSGPSGLVDNFDTVNTDIPGNQQSPDIAYAGGKFHIVWQDNATGKVMYRNVAVQYTGMEGLAETFNVSVTPNPFSGTATLRFDNPDLESFKLSIYDMAGREQHSLFVNSGIVTISSVALSPGTYFYVLAHENQMQRGKIIIL